MALHQKQLIPKCQICGEENRNVLRQAALVRPAVSGLIRKEIGSWVDHGWICLNDLEKYRNRYVQSLLVTERGELGTLEQEVLESLKDHEVLSRDHAADFETDLTFGQRVADRVADFGGSWSFLFVFGFFFAAWMAVNSYLLVARPFDPYPYILLNLILSSLAAIQAPVIMMSQNRQEARDQLRAQHDFQINLKAELEIRQLHQKIDHMLSAQWERLVEIQQIQMELINELRSAK